MKKLLFAAIFTLLAGNLLMAQAYEGTTKYDKKTQRAIVIDYGFPTDAVQNAFIERMGKYGFKPKEEKGLFNKDKGFLVFSSAYISEISPEAMDVIINVERKSRKESETSTLYMILAKGDNNAIDKMDVVAIANAKKFLNDLLPDVEAANLELKITEQQDKLAKAEKKLRDLKDEQTNLEKKLSDNQKDQEGTASDIDGQKKTLDELISRRVAKQ